MKNIIRENLPTTNTVVLAAVTVRKNEETISLLSRSYAFSLDGYLQKICEKSGKYQQQLWKENGAMVLGAIIPKTRSP